MTLKDSYDSNHSFEIIEILITMPLLPLSIPFGSDLFLIAKYPEHLEVNIW